MKATLQVLYDADAAACHTGDSAPPGTNLPG